MLTYSCVKNVDNDVLAVAGYLKYFDDPEEVVFTKIDKYVFEDCILYNVAWLDDFEGYEQTIDLILEFSPATAQTRLCFWEDMKYSSKADVKKLWDEREEKALSSISYNENQILEISKKAAEYCKIAYD